MSEKQNKITITELKAYLYSLEDEKIKKKEEEIKKYKEDCIQNNRRVREKELLKIERAINKEYETKINTKNDILELIDECIDLPIDMQRLEVTKYMLYRANVRRAEIIVSKAIKRLGKLYNDTVGIIDKKVYEFHEFDDVEEINFSELRPTEDILKNAKEKFKEEYTEEEKKKLIERELEIIERVKVFNTTPIPHEILRNSDRDIQSKMQKFNNIRQKRLRVIESMKTDYQRLILPREINAMIDDAITNVEEVKEILTKSEYNGIKNNLIKKRKKVYKNTNDARNIIKAKEKKTGILSYNMQEARYNRMENLRNIISTATNIINENIIPGAEDKLEKLRISYAREKQFAAVIEKLDDNPGENSEVRVYEEQIKNLEERMKNSNKIIKEKKEEIAKAKRELVILWKMEMESTIYNKRETLELPSPSQNTENVEEITNNKKTSKKFLFKVKKMQGGKHAHA